MDASPVIRIWVTNKNNSEITTEINKAMVDFLSSAIDNGCNGFTFAEDAERVIVYTVWSDENTLEKFRSSDDYKNREKEIINSFFAADFQLPDDILFNSTAKILRTYT
tara:strand:+ start:202 stop:525 length:324 start_codon:yes stop_codon:yes gene_type:complete